MKNKLQALVTGSSGFVGGYLVRSLLQQGYDVSCLVRAASPESALAGLPVTRVRGSYFDLDSLCRAVEGMDYIFHAGAVLSAPHRQDYFKTNTEGTANILQACVQANPGLRKFVYISSIAAAGPAIDKKPLRESAPCQPVSAYGESKYLAEQAAAVLFAKLPIVIVRAANVFGVGQKELLDVLKMMRLRIVPVIGRREKQASICFVQDLVRALVLVAEDDRARGKTYFVVAPEFYSWREITAQLLKEMDMKRVLKVPHPLLMGLAVVFEAVARLTGKVPMISREVLDLSHNYYWLYDASLIREELGFSTEIEFAQGIRDIVQDFKARS
jgi:nucleoside-diphosphate-sugar epimerase